MFKIPVSQEDYVYVSCMSISASEQSIAANELCPHPQLGIGLFRFKPNIDFLISSICP